MLPIRGQCVPSTHFNWISRIKFTRLAKFITKSSFQWLREAFTLFSLFFVFIPFCLYPIHSSLTLFVPRSFRSRQVSFRIGTLNWIDRTSNEAEAVSLFSLFPIPHIQCEIGFFTLGQFPHSCAVNFKSQASQLQSERETEREENTMRMHIFARTPFFV